MKIYLVRHGETDWNKQGLMQGNTDVPLNENGISQALQTADILKDKNIDICYSSPLTRAYETAKIIYNDNNIITDSRLIERELGEYEGKNFKLYNSKYYWDRHINSSENGVESPNDLIARVELFYNDIKTKYRDSNILIVTHGAVVRALNYIICGYDDNTDFSLFDVPNCYVFEYDV